MWSWIAIGVSALIFGRAFCGWACPGGMVAELLATVSVIKIKLNETAVRVAGYGKYIMLGLSLYFFFTLNNPRWAVPIRTGEFLNAVRLTFEHATNLWLCKTIAFLVLFILGGLLIPHLWCRFLCPTGGLLEVFNRFAPIKATIVAGCTDCDVCRNDCTLQTRPAAANCTNCGGCLDRCPTEAIRIQGLPGRMQERRQHLRSDPPERSLPILDD
jgi:polyferredoxin